MLVDPKLEFHKVFPVDVRGHVAVIRPHGDSISFRDSDIQSELHRVEKLLEDPEVCHLVIDLGDSRYFGTLMLGCFQMLGRKTAERGGRAAICNASPEMRQMLSATNLDKSWNVHDSLKAALKAVQG